MALYIGCEPGLTEETVWYKPCIDEPDACAPIRLEPENEWFGFQLDLIDAMVEAADGRYFVGAPDMVENWDVLASMRETQRLLMDMLDRPEWVQAKIDEIQEAWFDAYEPLYQKVRAQDGESMFGWFRTYGPGRVAKVQCDGASMMSPAMFRAMVVPALARQCEWLDYSMFHLDGSSCIVHLDALLEIDALTAVEWTPDPKVPNGGSLHWADLYRRILDAGKSVQVLGAAAEQIEPLLDAVGPDGVYFLSFFRTEAEAEKYERVAEKLR
jgi:hypothetical protein